MLIYDKNNIKIFNGDILEEIKNIADNSIDCCITSPPYFSLRSYLPKDHPDKLKEIGLESSMEEYLAKILSITAEIKRVLKSTGSFWLNYGDSYGGFQGKYAGYPDQKLRQGEHIPNRKISMKAKSLLCMPDRIKLKMIDDDGDDIYELRKDLTKEQYIAILDEMNKYGEK